jgi:diguanylate cyclase (GGDEF)-like protein
MTIRMGGEEFAVIAPATDTASAFSLAERIRRNIESTPVQAADDEIRITISIGVADMGGAPIFGTTQLDDLLAKADRALYQAKKKGRNRTEIWSEKLIAAAPDG